jgi:hypothetical protein
MDKLKRFAVDYVTYVVKGSPAFYAWIAFLCILILGLLYGTYLHAAEGLRYTGLTDQVHDGLYLANFVFLVGIAAGAVTIVFPAYVYRHKGLHAVAVLGEMLAISAVLMCILFIISHMGRPDRLWHMLPIIGIYNLPHSMLAWDTLVLVGYMLLNFAGGFYFLYRKYTGQPLEQEVLYAPDLYLDRLGIEHSYGDGIPPQHHAVAPDVASQHDADSLHPDCICSRAVADHPDLSDRALADPPLDRQFGH